MKLVILGNPAIKKNRHQIIRTKAGKPAIIANKGARAWEKSAVEQLEEQWQGKPAISSPCHLALDVFLSPRQRGDLLNYLEAPPDAMQKAGILQDDRLVEVVTARVHHKSDQPRVEAVIETLE